MNKLIESVKELTEKELNEKWLKYASYATHYEAFAVLLKEYQQTMKEVKEIRRALQLYWRAVKEKAFIDEYRMLKEIEEHAYSCTAAVIQLAHKTHFAQRLCDVHKENKQKHEQEQM